MIKNLNDLEKIKKDTLQEKGKIKIRVMVGMSSCGIAAGAKDVHDKLISVLKNHNVSDVDVQKTGCAGFCYKEPTIEIFRGSDSILLGPVLNDDVDNVVDMHILNDLKKSKYVINKNYISCMDK